MATNENVTNSQVHTYMTRYYNGIINQENRLGISHGHSGGRECVDKISLVYSRICM